MSVNSKSGLIVYGNVLNENTPIGRGVHSYLTFYSLYGGHKPDGSKLIPVDQICTPLGRSECGYDAGIDA